LRCEKPKANHGRYMPTKTYVPMPAAHLAGAGFRNGKEYMCGPWSGCEYRAHVRESTAKRAKPVECNPSTAATAPKPAPNPSP
jgi:hypothetical protein